MATHQILATPLVTEEVFVSSRHISGRLPVIAIMVVFIEDNINEASDRKFQLSNMWAIYKFTTFTEYSLSADQRSNLMSYNYNSASWTNHSLFTQWLLPVCAAPAFCRCSRRILCRISFHYRPNALRRSNRRSLLHNLGAVLPPRALKVTRGDNDCLMR